MKYVQEELAKLANSQRNDVAVVDDHGVTTYGELADRVRQLGKTFSTNNCRYIAILADNGSDWIVTDLAALHAGLTVVPVPPFFSPTQIANSKSSIVTPWTSR